MPRRVVRCAKRRIPCSVLAFLFLFRWVSGSVNFSLFRGPALKKVSRLGGLSLWLAPLSRQQKFSYPLPRNRCMEKKNLIKTEHGLALPFRTARHNDPSQQTELPRFLHAQMKGGAKWKNKIRTMKRQRCARPKLATGSKWSSMAF